MKRRLDERYGPWALVTGAARGIGAEFARQLASAGIDLLLVDVLDDEAAALARELTAAHGVQARAVDLDLTRPDLVQALAPELEEIEVGLLVNNAALGPIGPFLSQERATKLRTVELNCRAPLLLTDWLLPPMVRRGRGGVIFLSSCSAYQGVPLVATYAGTKAFNLILGESLWAELRGTGVDVLVLSPGETDTEGFRASAPVLDSWTARLTMDSASVVREALQALGRQPTLIPGSVNRVVNALTRRFPGRRWAIELFDRGMRGLYPRFE